MDFSFNHGPPRLYVSADSLNKSILQDWKDEGYVVSYLPYDNKTKKEYITQLRHLGDPLGLGEKFGIIGYGDAAAIILNACSKPMSKLCAFVAYYPTQYAKTSAGYPPNTEVLVHAAGAQKVPLKCRSYNYPHSDMGFAEPGLKTYDQVSASLAWSRTLGAVRKGFGIHVGLESIWENHVDLEFNTKDAAATLATMSPTPYVNHIPTCTGGLGARDLLRFYADFFIPCNPPSLRMRLLSRTEGTDRIVDELFLSFTHSAPMPWMLPGVAPTHKHVEIVLVSVVCIRGGKLCQEHIYWDQASVLVQVGLLDPKVVPGGAKVAKRLPVMGREAARKVLDGGSVRSNGLIEEWWGKGQGGGDEDEGEEDEEDDEEEEGEDDDENEAKEKE